MQQPVYSPDDFTQSIFCMRLHNTASLVSHATRQQPPFDEQLLQWQEDVFDEVLVPLISEENNVNPRTSDVSSMLITVQETVISEDLVPVISDPRTPNAKTAESPRLEDFAEIKSMQDTVLRCQALLQSNQASVNKQNADTLARVTDLINSAASSATTTALPSSLPYPIIPSTDPLDILQDWSPDEETLEPNLSSYGNLGTPNMRNRRSKRPYPEAGTDDCRRASSTKEASTRIHEA